MSSRFDGLEVDQHQARFAGTFDIDSTDEHRMSLDAEIMFIAVARVGGATITETQSGDVRRTNKLDVRQVAVVRDKETQDQLYETLSHQLLLPDPQFDFGPPLETPPPRPSNVSSDGELFVVATGDR